MSATRPSGPGRMEGGPDGARQDGGRLTDQFRDAMSRFASGVTVVTARDGEGRPVGFTASAFTSLSLQPPLILVCLDRRAESFPVFQNARHFAVSILSAGQSDAAMRFGTRGADKFGRGATVAGSTTGLPLLPGSLAHIECAMHDQLDGGDHVILVGRVLRASIEGEEPLLYFDRGFGSFSPFG